MEVEETPAAKVYRKPKCDGCRISKEMSFAGLICGRWVWRIFHCTTCYDTIYKTRMDKWGFHLTKWVWRGEVMFLPDELI